jgi:hypothetical protein
VAYYYILYKYNIFICFFLSKKGDEERKLGFPGWRLEGDWRETGGRLEGDWRETGGILEGDWRETGGRLEGDWRETGGERFDVLSHSATLTPGNPGNPPVSHPYPNFYFRSKTLVKKDPSYRAFMRNEK